VKNRPGYSWGPDLPINLMRTSRGWTLIDFSKSPPTIVAAIPKKRGALAKDAALRLGDSLNYGDSVVDAETLAAIDATP